MLVFGWVLTLMQTSVNFNTANYYQNFTVLLTTYISSPTARDNDLTNMFL